ncbi:MAG TPA: DNA polymerase I [Trueperaceae bacterium]
MKTFYVIDGHAQLFRAYYAPFRDLTGPNGEPVKAVYVFTQLLINLLRNVRPDYLAIAFDVSDSTTLRKGDFADYKANRDHAPDDLHSQYARIRQVVEAMGIKVYEMEGHEADDVIATIAERLKGEDVELRIGSKDKDLHQILSDKVKLWDPSSGELLGPRELLETRGYTPEQSVEVQTLTGDSTDNIPGAKGVGTKTAAKLVAKYGSADAVMEHLDELTPKLRENLAEHRENMHLTRRLVTLERDVPIDFSLEDCVTPRPTRRDLRELFEELGFRSFLDQLDFAGPDAVAAATEAAPSDVEGAGMETDYRVVNTPEAFEAFVAELEKQEAFALDTETTALRAVDAEIVGYVFSWQAGTGWYVPVRGEHGETLDPDTVAARLKPVLENESTLKVGQNLKYDIIALSRAGIELKGPLFDTMVAAALLYPGRRTYNMDDLARDLLGVKTTPITDLIGKGKDQLSMLQVPLDQIAAYAAEDADITWRLYERLAKGIDAEPVNGHDANGRSRAAGNDGATLKQLFTEVEMPLVRVLSDMEREGVSLDAGMLTAYAETIKGRIEELKARMVEVVGQEFNPDSPKQLAEVLFDRLGMRVVKTTKTGRSTDAEVLETLAAETDHPLLPLLLEYRELNKILGTYLLPLPGYLSPVTGRLHASFHQTGAATGRLSSSDPNIQNIPIRTAAGREIRRAFRARDEDSVLITADYSQVELRMLAHFSDDAELVKAFKEGQDIHAFVASQVFGVPIEEVTPDQRRIAKTVNFGIVYGQTSFGLARTLRIPRGDAQRFIDEYKERYAGLDRFLKTCVEEAEDLGYVTTILGRRREIPEIRSRNRNQRFLGERLAINSVIQGSAADLIKVAMVKLRERLQTDCQGAKLLIQVHDELVLEAPRDVSEAVVRATVETMTGALPLRVPLKVDASVGTNWLEVKA